MPQRARVASAAAADEEHARAAAAAAADEERARLAAAWLACANEAAAAAAELQRARHAAADNYAHFWGSWEKLRVCRHFSPALCGQCYRPTKDILFLAFYDHPFSNFRPFHPRLPYEEPFTYLHLGGVAVQRSRPKPGVG